MPTLPAIPSPFTFPPAHTALIIIDMQRDFIEPGGFGDALGNNVALLKPIIPALQKVLAACRKHGITVIHTREGHDPALANCPPAKLRSRSGSAKPPLRIGDPGPMGRILITGEPGNDIIPELAPLPNERVIDKPGKGAFYDTPLHSILQESGITHLLFSGVTTEVCVQTSMREANDRGYDSLLLEDCTESYFPEFKAATLAMLRAQGGIIGWTAPSYSLLHALES